MRLGKEARGMIKSMSASERKAALAAAKLLYRNGLMTLNRYNALARALQKFQG